MSNVLSSNSVWVSDLDMFRIKEKLRSGEMAVSGDQWPIFIYHGYSYDPEDPWNGLFRSTLLISVSRFCI